MSAVGFVVDLHTAAETAPPEDVLPSKERERLIAELLKRSESKDWATARAEWEYFSSEVLEGYETCLCGQYPIRELCWMRNRSTNEVAAIGNVCVLYFVDRDLAGLFSSIKRVTEEKDKKLDWRLVESAWRAGVITRFDLEWYSETFSKRRSDGRVSINNRILGWLEDRLLGNVKVLQQSRRLYERAREKFSAEAKRASLARIQADIEAIDSDPVFRFNPRFREEAERSMMAALESARSILREAEQRWEAFLSIGDGGVR